MTANDPTSSAYLRTKIMTANPAELRMMLFDAAIRFAQQARDGLLTHDSEASYIGLTRCQSILVELINGVQSERQSSVSLKLSGLYTFMYTQLMKAGSQREPALVDEVIKLLQFERQTWSMVIDQLARENQLSQAMQCTPHAQPPVGEVASKNTQALVGGIVSVRG